MRRMSSMRLWLLSGLSLAVSLGAFSCQEKLVDKLVKSACREDSDCDAGLICENFQCVPAETRACENVLNGNPILQPSPHNIRMGEVDQSVTS